MDYGWVKDRKNRWTLRDGSKWYVVSEGVAEGSGAGLYFYRTDEEHARHWIREDGGSVDDMKRLAELHVDHDRRLPDLRRHWQFHPMWTPWGDADGYRTLAAGIARVSTEGHGGIAVRKDRMEEVPPILKLPVERGFAWYEEDQEYALVTLAFPLYFTPLERMHAERTIRAAYPEIAAIMDEVRTRSANAGPDDWKTVYALVRGGTDDTTVTAKKNGERRTFLVPLDEYCLCGEHDFVVDPERHPEVPEPGFSMRM
jgi:hypothetical protein